MLSRSIRRHVAQGMLCAMLFAQAALAAAACDWLRVAPAQAIAANADEPSCHEEPARDVTLCLAHCLGGDQSADTPQVAIPAWSQSSLFVVLHVESGLSRKLITQFTLPRPGAPPLRILFHSFLI